MMATARVKKAVEMKAILFTAQCPCGGSVYDDLTGSYDLERTTGLRCDNCDEQVEVTKRTARI